MADIHIIHDPTDQANVSQIAPNLLDFRSCALRVEPTPEMARDGLTDDLLRALRRRPNLAFRWSDGAIGPVQAARLWCQVHGIRHIVVPRAHTIATKLLTDLLDDASHDPLCDVLNKPQAWWLIDASEDGSLACGGDLPEFGRGAVATMLGMIRNSQEDDVRFRASKVAHQPALTTFDHAVTDAHPLLFGERLLTSQPAEAADAAHERFTSAGRVMRSSCFKGWKSALWHCLRAARSDADALILFRGAQLALLEQRMHLTMRSDPWAAAADAPTRLAADADALLAYVDPLVASIGGLAIQTGFCAGALHAVSIRDVAAGAVPTIPAFDAGAQDRRIKPYVRAQIWAVQAGALDRDSHALFRRYLHASYRGGTRSTTASVDRITAVLKTLEIERGIDWHYSQWIADHGISVVPV